MHKVKRNVHFRTSSVCYGQPGICVAVGRSGDSILVKDTKTDKVLTFSGAEWDAFVAGVKKNEFDTI